MNFETLKGMAEKTAYGIAMVILMRLVAKGYLTAELAEYLAGGLLLLVGNTISFIRNRPQNLLSRAQGVMPGNSTKLEVVPAMSASVTTVNKIEAITALANDNVTTKMAA